jgi:hypothetical protein
MTDVCPLDGEVVEQPFDVVSEIDERVRHRTCPAQHIAEHPAVHRAVGAAPAHLRRQAGIAVVEPGHPIALLDQPRAEAVGPHRQLRADAHDQQHRRVGGSPRSS